MATFILTVLGDDRPGLVSAISAPINAHGGSWERSQLSRLEGKFAGIVVVTAPDAAYEALSGDLSALASQGLKVILDRADDAEPGERLRLSLNLLGDDRPGIVAEISAALADLSINIGELTTAVREAPMAGGMLFDAQAVLEAPSGTDTEQVRAMLETLANELMVEISLDSE